MISAQRLQAQLDFILEIDKLKRISRRSLLSDGSREENSAEHSWQVALMAFTLAEHANAPVDAARAAEMLLIHDLVEIDAGDSFLYDEGAQHDKLARESAAAQRLFALLPAEQGAHWLALWREFELGDSPEARYARALDRLMPMLLNAATCGRAWQTYGVSAEQVLARNAHIAEGSQVLWDYARSLIAACVEHGYLPEHSESFEDGA